MNERHRKDRIRLKAFRPAVIDQASADIVRTARRRAQVTADSASDQDAALDRAPQSARGQEEPGAVRLKTHKRLIDIMDSRPQTVDALTKLDLPAGVDVEIKVEWR